MLDFEADDEVKGIDQSPHSPMPSDTYRHLHRQMIMLTIVVAGLLVFVVYGVVDAVWNGNLPEFCVATPTLLLLLWVLYKIIRGWVVALPAVKPHDAPTSIRPRLADIEDVNVGRSPQARPRGTSRQRVIIGWAIATAWTTYGILSWPAHPEWPTPQHLLRMVPALFFVAIALRRTLNRRRHLTDEAVGQR